MEVKYRPSTSKQSLATGHLGTELVGFSSGSGSGVLWVPPNLFFLQSDKVQNVAVFGDQDNGKGKKEEQEEMGKGEVELKQKMKTVGKTCIFSLVLSYHSPFWSGLQGLSAAKS